MRRLLAYDRKTAWSITVLIIIISFMGGGAKSLNRLKNTATDIFYNGADGDGMGVQRELDHRASYAQNMLTVANRYIKDDAAVRQAQAACDDLLGSVGIADKSKNDKKLSEAVSQLYERLGKEKLSENDARYRESLYEEINARSSRISNDAYNGEAREYNRKLSVFPASLIRAARLAEELPVF